MDLKPLLPGAGHEVRALRQELAGARDDQIRRVVGMVDRLPERGAADALIAPLRGRLARLRPVRPLGLGRLLFTPLNPVIVAGAAWRRDALAVPRTALAPLEAQVRAAVPEVVAAVEAMLDGAATTDLARLRSAGACLWPEAARVIAEGPMPPRWDGATGLSAADHRGIARIVGCVLAEGTAIEAEAMAEVPDDAALEAMLRRAALAGSLALGVLIAVLLQRVPSAGRLVSLAAAIPVAEAGLSGRTLTDRAVDLVLDGLEAMVPAGEAAADIGPSDLGQAVMLIDSLQEQLRDRPSRCARIVALRQRMDAGCRVRFEATLRTGILDRLAAVPGGADEAVTGLEAAARDLRRFERVARRINGSDHYDRVLRRTAGALAVPAGLEGAALVDRLRLAEILLGPEAAYAMLEASAAAAASGAVAIPVGGGG